MRLPTFWGGIHPPQNKDLTVNEGIEPYLPQGELVFPMAQNIGAPCSPVVAKGDKVLVAPASATTTPSSPRRSFQAFPER